MKSGCHYASPKHRNESAEARACDSTSRVGETTGYRHQTTTTLQQLIGKLWFINMLALNSSGHLQSICEKMFMSENRNTDQNNLQSGYTEASFRIS